MKSHHKSASLPTTEAEYRAVTKATKDMLYAKNPFDGLKLQLDLPIMLWGDNLNVNGHANGTISTGPTRHILLHEKMNPRSGVCEFSAFLLPCTYY